MCVWHLEDMRVACVQCTQHTSSGLAPTLSYALWKWLRARFNACMIFPFSTVFTTYIYCASCNGHGSSQCMNVKCENFFKKISVQLSLSLCLASAVCCQAGDLVHACKCVCYGFLISAYAFFFCASVRILPLSFFSTRRQQKPANAFYCQRMVRKYIWMAQPRHYAFFIFIVLMISFKMERM